MTTLVRAEGLSKHFAIKRKMLRAVVSDGSVFTYENVTVTVTR